MRVHVEHRWQQQALAIWVTETTPGMKPRCLHVVGGDGEGDVSVRWDEYEAEVFVPGEPKPTLVLATEVAEAIVKELGDHIPAPDATAFHLKDAISVRDRLLALIEESNDRR